jgi:hypothetical protein
MAGARPPAIPWPERRNAVAAFHSFQFFPQRHGVERQCQDSLPQPDILCLKKRKEAYRPALRLSMVLLTRFPITRL